LTLYDERITSVSLDALREIAVMMDFPVCLCGGWAVYFTVNDFFRKQKDSNYIGSQDIDIGFYIAPMISKSEFASTDLKRALTILESDGFEKEGFRYRKEILPGRSRVETRQFTLFVDILVNSYPPSINDIYPDYFIEVPLIEDVFADRENRVVISEVSPDLFMPSRSILTSMKILSLPSGGREGHKRIKDLCDIYSLLWFSDRSVHENVNGIIGSIDNGAIDRLRDSIDKRLIKDCEMYLGEEAGSMDTVLGILFEGH